MNNLLKEIQSFNYVESKLFTGSSCAIVGSAGKLLDTAYGKEIDSHDFVLRFNTARVFGYEKHVGSKTSLRLINAHQVAAINGDMQSHNENASVFSAFSADVFKELKETNYLCKRDVYTNVVSKMYPDSVFNKLSHETTAFLFSKINPVPTTGFLGIALCIANFDKISCYGFDQYSGAADHYYQTVKPYNRGSVHNLNTETKFLTYLHNNKIIELR